jgi:hypothetical protein
MRVALFAACVVSGCFMTLHPKLGLYPVRGPLTAETPVREGHIRFTAHVTLTPVHFWSSKSGEITATLGDGEICKGRWEWMPAPADNSMASDWGTVYGQGNYVAGPGRAEVHAS